MAAMVKRERIKNKRAPASALRSIPRDALVLIDTPDGPKRLRMVVGTHVGEREGRIVQRAQSERYAVILQAER